MRITSLRCLMQVYALHVLLLTIGELIPPCAAGVAVVEPLGALAGVVPPIQPVGIRIEDCDAYEERNGTAGPGYGHTDKPGENKRTEGRPRARPTEHLGALGRRIGEHYRILTEGRRVGRACHQEHKEHDPDKPRELLKTCGRKISSEYKCQTGAYHSEYRVKHADAPPPLVP